MQITHTGGARLASIFISTASKSLHYTKHYAYLVPALRACTSYPAAGFSPKGVWGLSSQAKAPSPAAFFMLTFHFV